MRVLHVELRGNKPEIRQILFGPYRVLKKQLQRSLVISALAILLPACSNLPLIGSDQSPTGFQSFRWNPAIQYEPGAEALAEALAHHYPQALAAVEQAHFYRFARAPAVLVCASDNSFGRLVDTPSPISHVTAATYLNKTFISPKLYRQPQRIFSVLAHELSHLHLMLWLGPGRYAEQLPVWFQEGLAVDIAGGGGAETVTEQQAAAAIRQGYHFNPQPSTARLFGRRAFADGLEPHMYYRQSAMFVRFLRDDPASFQRLMRGLIHGADFSNAIAHAYGMPLAGLWQAFVRRVSLNS
jgi:hypothetical protein